MVLATEKVSKSPNAKRLDSKCDCGRGLLRQTECFNEWWLQCNDCDRFVFCYEPMEHQMDFHLDTHKIKMWSGGLKLPSPQNKNKSQIRWNSKGIA